MHLLGRRGFTLIELLVALVLLGIVTAGIYRVLVNNQRVYQAQTQRIDLQQNIRAAVTILPAELREMNASGGDIAAMSATSLSIRAMRQLALICSPPPLGGALGNISMVVRRSPFFGRALNPATDSLLIYYEGDEGSRSDDSWVLANVGAVVNQNCPDGPAGWQITMTPSFIAGQLNQLGAIPNGAPVRGFETVTYRLYQAPDNLWYIGLENVSGIQPLIGPVTSDGLSLRYFNAAGAETADRTQVAEIEIGVRARTAQPVQGGAGGGLVIPVDSIVTRVALRNNRRF